MFKKNQIMFTKIQVMFKKLKGCVTKKDMQTPPPFRNDPIFFLLYMVRSVLNRNVLVELARFARGRIEDSSLTGSRSTAFQNCLPHCFLA